MENAEISLNVIVFLMFFPIGFYIKAVRVIAIVFTFVPLYTSVLAEEAGFGFFFIKHGLFFQLFGFFQ